MMFCFQGQWILNMASPYWTRLPFSSQTQYAALYQKAYSQEKQWPLQKKFSEKKVEFSMVLVPPGQFILGRPFSEKGDGPALKVVVPKPYWMSQYETTQKQWFSLAKNKPCMFWYKRMLLLAMLRTSKSRKNFWFICPKPTDCLMK
jgi:formylglycine-generating enzyme required for sulfatase activity